LLYAIVVVFQVALTSLEMQLCLFNHFQQMNTLAGQPGQARPCLANTLAYLLDTLICCAYRLQISTLTRLAQSRFCQF
jgi:hypothetical protein